MYMLKIRHTDVDAGSRSTRAVSLDIQTDRQTCSVRLTSVQSLRLA